MSTDVWILIGVIVLMLLILAIIVFLESIDIIDEDTGRIIFVCTVIPPLGLLLLITYCLILLHNLCSKHKDKIRKFLKIK